MFNPWVWVDSKKLENNNFLKYFTYKEQDYKKKTKTPNISCIWPTAAISGVQKGVWADAFTCDWGIANSPLESD